MAITDRRRNKKKRKRKPGGQVGRPSLDSLTVDDLSFEQESYASLIARGTAPTDARKILNISDYQGRRWEKCAAVIERINQLTDEEQSMIALNFLEKKLQKFGGSASLMISLFAVETREALHKFFMAKIGREEISWGHALQLARDCEEKFGAVTAKDKVTKEVEMSTFDLLKAAGKEEAFKRLQEPGKVILRETVEEV